MPSNYATVVYSRLACPSSAGVYEEEDFQPGLYGYGVCAEVPEARAAAAVREVEEELQRVVKSSRSRQGEAWEPLMQKQVGGGAVVQGMGAAHAETDEIWAWKPLIF